MSAEDDNVTFVDDGEQQSISSEDPDEQVLPTKDDNNRLLYGVEDDPPIYLTIFLGLQHYLTMLAATIATPYLLAPALCIGSDDPARADLLSTILIVSGIVTFLQVTFGSRLPLIQGSTITYIIPSLAILSLPEWKCPSNVNNGTNTTSGVVPNQTREEKGTLWQERMCELQGAILVASVLEMVLGFTGAIGFLIRFITPLAMTPVMTLLGIALFQHAAEFASGNWGIAALTIALMVIFAEYLGEVNIPCCSYSKGGGCGIFKLPLFKLFPVLLTIILVWILCAILTATDALPKDNLARTDINLKLIQDAPWFRVPYPGQWGIPTVSLAGAFGMCGAGLASVIVTVGNFYACARFSKVPAPPIHAINRGVFIEGIGVALAGIWGTGDGTMSYAENIGVISVTKVASRRVFQASAIFMIGFSLICKFGALFVSMPQPMVGGGFFVMFSLMSSVGLSNLQFANLESPRNLIVIGLPLFCGLAIPDWLNKHPGAIQTGNTDVDNILEVMLTTSVFVGGFLGLLLDNTVPGSDEDRGLIKWRNQLEAAEYDDSTSGKCYNLPFGQNFLQNSKVARLIPVSPSFEPRNCASNCRKRTESTVPVISIDNTR